MLTYSRTLPPDDQGRTGTPTCSPPGGPNDNKRKTSSSREASDVEDELSPPRKPKKVKKTKRAAFDEVSSAHLQD